MSLFMVVLAGVVYLAVLVVVSVCISDFVVAKAIHAALYLRLRFGRLTYQDVQNWQRVVDEVHFLKRFRVWTW